MQLSVPVRRRSRPSLIPLIDVMLVLLFFFMLVGTYAGYTRTSLELAPSSRAGGPPAADEPDVLRAIVLADGQLKVGAAVFDPLPAIAQLRLAREVRLSPAPGVPLQRLLASWDQLSAAGVKVQLAEGAP